MLLQLRWAGWIIESLRCMWSKMAVVTSELLIFHVGARFWLLRAALLETWVLVDKVCALAGLTMGQLALQGFGCRAAGEGGALVYA